VKISFTVNELPPKKDGANSMWRKGSELARLKALRIAASEAMKDIPLIKGNLLLTIRIFADSTKGDLDNFITGICDGLMAAHPLTPIDHKEWLDLPEAARPHRPICYSNDALINSIAAKRLPPDEKGDHYYVELEW